MTLHTHDLFPQANTAGVGKRRQNVEIDATGDESDKFEEKIRKVCLKIWPRHGEAPARLALYCGFSTREGQRFMARQRNLSAFHLRNLQRGEFGRHFWDLTQEGSDAPWWKEVYADLELAAMEKKARDLMRQVKKRREGNG